MIKNLTCVPPAMGYYALLTLVAINELVGFLFVFHRLFKRGPAELFPDRFSFQLDLMARQILAVDPEGNEVLLVETPLFERLESPGRALLESPAHRGLAEPESIEKASCYT